MTERATLVQCLQTTLAAPTSDLDACDALIGQIEELNRTIYQWLRFVDEYRCTEEYRTWRQCLND